MTPPPSVPTPLPAPPLRPAPNRRAKVVGSVVAVSLLAGLGGLTWYLTQPASPQGAASAGSTGQPGPGGPGGGRFGAGGAPSTVGVATAERVSVPVLLDALGTVTPLATVKVRPQVSGMLDKVLFKEGQTVRAGDLLATIDARQFELALAQASGQRQRDSAQLDNAKVTLQRFKTLLGQDSIARQDVDTQAALVKQLEGTVTLDTAAEGVAKLNLSYTRITAPISGRVGLRTVDAGNMVSSSDINGVAVITQVTPMDVIFSVSQDRVSDLMTAAGNKSQADMQVIAFDRTRSSALGSGTFASLDNQIDTTTGTVKAKARFSNADGTLFANQFVNIQLRIKSIDNAVVVPVTAVRLGGNGDYVFVLNAEQRTVSIRAVTRGQSTGEKTVIASGLKAGEQVITEGADRLKDGGRVTLAGDAPRSGGRRQGASAAQGASTSAVTAPASAAAPASSGAAPAAFPQRALPAENSAAASGALATPANLPPVSAASSTQASSRPTPEQRQRLLDQVKDNPEALERRKKFLEKLDTGDAQALERWQGMQQRMQQGGDEGGGQGRERPAK